MGYGYARALERELAVRRLWGAKAWLSLALRVLIGGRDHHRLQILSDTQRNKPAWTHPENQVPANC